MLTREEARQIYDICLNWPGGLGCVLLPDTTNKRGFKTADWGWRGKRYGDFDYTRLSQFENPLLCPVTSIGIMQGARNFQDHMAVYRSINETLSILLNREYDEIKKIYNFLLSRYPLSLAAIFDNYIQNVPIEGYPLSLIISGYYAELNVHTGKGHMKAPVAIMATDSNTIWTVDEVAFDRDGKPVNQKLTSYLEEWK